MEHTQMLTSLSDDELLRRLRDLLRRSRRTEAELVAHIAEVDARRLYAREAATSMFAYCTGALALSEAEAYLRITVARASREHPVLLAMLADGRLHLSAIAKLAPHLNPGNRDAVLARAARRSKREIEELVAELAPRPDAPSVVRRLPAAPQLRPDGVEALALPPPVPDAHAAQVPCATPATSSAVTGKTTGEPGPVAKPVNPSPPAAIQPLSPSRYKLQVTISAELHQKLERLTALMRSVVPSGDLAVLLDHAVTEKLARLETRRFAATNKPRKAVDDVQTAARSRYIPAPVRRAVYRRDGARCRYTNAQGTRCTARDSLEFHHRHPFGHGGAHEPENLSLMCRTHNAYLAALDYGGTAPPARRAAVSNRKGAQAVT